jgi:hypothetical protein
MLRYLIGGLEERLMLVQAKLDERN